MFYCERYLLICSTIAVLLFSGGKTSAQALPTEELMTKEISMAAGADTLYGTLTDPLLCRGGRGDCVVLIIAGSGPTDRDCNNNTGMKSNTYKYLAEELYAKGIACFRYDKRGIGKSTRNLKEAQYTIDLYIQDASMWAKKLQMDYKRVFLLGHSEGALIASAVAVSSKKVSGVISIAGVGRKMDIVLKEQLSYLPINIKERLYSIIDSLSQGNKVENVPGLFNSLFRKSVQPFLISTFRLSPTDLISRLEQPLLIIQGDKDIQVSVADAQLLHNSNPKSELVIIKDMNHVLKQIESTDKVLQLKSYYDAKSPIVNEVVINIAKFIDNKGRHR